MIEDWMSPTTYEISVKLSVSYQEAERIMDIVLKECSISEENYVGDGYAVERG
jgi:hypothetical protein